MKFKRMVSVKHLADPHNPELIKVKRVWVEFNNWVYNLCDKCTVGFDKHALSNIAFKRA